MHFPPPAWRPPPAIRRAARYYRWLFFGAGCIEPALLDKMLKRPDVEPKAAVGYGSYEDVVNALKGALGKGPYLLGDKFTAADVYVGAEINWAMMFGAPGLKGEPVFDDYVARLTDRPAYKRVAAANKPPAYG